MHVTIKSPAANKTIDDDDDDDDDDDVDDDDGRLSVLHGHSFFHPRYNGQ